MAGNFKYLKFLFLLLFFINCKNATEDKIAGKEIIDENMNRFISDLYGLSIEYHKNGKFPIFLNKKTGSNDFFKEHCESILEMGELNAAENCKEEFYKLINKEGFSIDKNTKYLSFGIDKNFSRDNTINKNIQLIENNSNIKSDAYVEIKFSNIYIDNKLKKAFVILEETDFEKGRYGGKVDIYFFTKKKNKWIFNKKLMLLTA